MKQFYERGEKCYYHMIHSLLWISATKWKSIDLHASNGIILESFCFCRNFCWRSLWTLNIYFEKSIPVKTTGKFCSGLQNEVIFE